MKESKHRKYIYINGTKTKYMVTDRGSVYSMDYKHTGKEKKLKTRLDKYGYVIVTIYLNGKRYDKKVHQLVAIAFIPNPKNKPEVNHKNGNKQKNNKGNLEWATNGENIYHSWDTGLHVSDQDGEKNPYCKYSEKTVRKVCKDLESNEFTMKEISKRNDVPRATIEQILYGNQWTEVSRDYDFSKFTKKRVYHDDKLVKKICKLLQDGKLTMPQIAEKVGVNYRYVFKVYKRETKKHISKDYDFSKVPLCQNQFGPKK